MNIFFPAILPCPMITLSSNAAGCSSVARCGLVTRSAAYLPVFVLGFAPAALYAYLVDRARGALANGP